MIAMDSIPQFCTSLSFLRVSQVAPVVKNPPANEGDISNVGLIPVSGRSPGGGNGNPLKYSCLKNLRIEEPGGLQSIGPQRVGQHSSKGY